MLNFKRFEDKNVVVTGATSGIGKEVAKRAAMEGGQVVAIGRNIERGEAVVKEIVENGGKAIFLKGDVSNEEDVNRIFQRIKEEIGEIHVLINNAGMIGHGERIDELSTQSWLELLNTNLNSAFLCCRAASQNMIKHGKGGAIVNTGSIAGVTGFYRSAAYVASKHGINGLTKAIAYDLAQFNIRCNSVNPSGTATPLVERSTREVQEKVKKAIDLGKTMDEALGETMMGMKAETLQRRDALPEEQASTILYFASDEAKHITGSIVMSDGGFTAY